MAHGRVCYLEPALDYGKIETADGRQVYFHRNSVIDASFDDLELGAELRFIEEAGEKGPQASSAYVIGKHHLVP
jgi:cold shock CspA family protein